jgi:ribonuclease Z
MSSRELIALGTSSQVPTRDRSHNAYFVRWDAGGFLFDPGENAQRQLSLAGISVRTIHTICISHFHGDHCLGLPGILQRLALDSCNHPVHIFYPESGQVFLERLCNASIYSSEIELLLHPLAPANGELVEIYRETGYVLKAHSLEHSVPTVGFRIEESDGRTFLPEKLIAAKVCGPMVTELKREGWIASEDGIIRLEDVSVHRPGTVLAYVMDSRPCSGAIALARKANLLVMEATFLSQHRALADLYAHSTASDAAETAVEAGVQRLALGHFSQRYPTADGHLAEAKRIFAESIVLADLDRVNIPRFPSIIH